MKKIYFIICLAALTLSLKAQVSEQEFQALKAIYNATGGDGWTDRTGWENINTTATKNDVTTAWKGISFISEGHIIDITFYNNNLTGSLPEEISGLKYISTLALNANHLTSPLPQALKELSSIKVFAMNGSDLNIPFPTDLITSWPNLVSLNLSSCGITGPLPDIFDKTPFLNFIDISSNNIEGELPPSLNDLNFKEFYCGNNGFEGGLPLLTNTKDIYRFSLSNNKFTGSIPQHYGDFVLQFFQIDNNNLSGSIPEKIFEAPIYLFNIEKNYFTFAGLEPVYNKINESTNKSFSTSKKMTLTKTEILVNESEILTLDASALSMYNLGGDNNRYKWFRDNVEVYSGNSPIYTIPSINSANGGIYRFEVTNTVVTNLTLKSENILVKTAHVNQPPTNITLSKQNIDENYSGIIGTLAATDPDASDTHTFSLVIGDGTNNKDNNKFSITGNQLSLLNKVDFELTKTLNILVGVSDGNGGTFAKAFTIKVNNVNETPQFIGLVTSKSIDETTANGFTVFNLMAQDPENDPITFTITQGNENGAFGIKGDLLIVKDSTKLDYNVKNSYSLTVSASDGILSSTAALTINLNNVNRFPQIEDATFSIDENSPAGTVVGSMTASDPDGDPIAISILTGNELSAFSVTGKSIQVTNPDALDFETNPVFALTVNITDGIANVQSTITIKLKDILELTGTNILTFSVPGMMNDLAIDNAAHTIKVSVISPNLSELISTFTLSPGASSIPASGTALDFSSPQTITVTSQSGDSQNWLVKVTCLVGKSEFENRTIYIFPNPTADYLNISGLHLNEDIKLISVTGEVLIQKTVSTETEEINLQNLKQGAYFIVVESNLNRRVQKIIKL
jgi:hypothetical protein